MLLLCDLDGTLVDRDAAFRSWCCDLASQHEQDDDFVDWMVAEDRAGAWARRELFPRVKERLGLNDSLEELTERFTSEFVASFRCVEGAREALETVIAAGHRVAVVTNGGRMQMDKIRAAGLDSLAHAVSVSSLEGCAKPDPRLLRVAAERAGCDIGGAWMIGDSIADITAASAAGVCSVWLRHGRSWSRPGFLPTVQVDCFSEGVEIVLADWAAGARA